MRRNSKTITELNAGTVKSAIRKKVGVYVPPDTLYFRLELQSYLLVQNNI